MSRIRNVKLLLVVMTGAVSVCGQQAAVTGDPFARLKFLLGTWHGQQSGEPGNGVSERTYTFVLNDRFLEVKNTSTYPPQEKNKAGEIHHDMGMIGYDQARNRLVFRQFHQEGFVNTYVQQDSSDPKKIIFVSEAIEKHCTGLASS